jgi:hypothetical protein
MDRSLPPSRAVAATAAMLPILNRVAAEGTAMSPAAAAPVAVPPAAATNGGFVLSPQAQPAAALPPRTSFHLTEEERQAMLQVMLQNTEINEATGEQKLKWGVTKAIASRFQVNRNTVEHLWKRAVESRKKHPLGLADVSSRMDRSGRKPMMSREEFEAKVEALPYEERTTVKSIAKHLGLPKSTAMQYAKQYLVRTSIDD